MASSLLIFSQPKKVPVIRVKERKEGYYTSFSIVLIIDFIIQFPFIKNFGVSRILL